MSNNNIGKRIVDISGIIAMYEAQEGEVHHIIGKTGMGKTYESTRRAFQYLYSGYTVYTTWRLNLPEYYDEREHIWPIIRNLILFRKNFVRINLRENWRYVNLDDFLDSEGIMDTIKLSKYLGTRTDCIFMMDEGQDVFDSHQKSGKIARQAITRSRHKHMTLIIISQRAQAVDVTARGNVTNFYKCERVDFPFLPPRFRVWRTDEIDESSSYPIWVRHDSTGRVVWRAQLWHSAFAKKWIFDAYDSWYMRKSMIRSQDIKIDAFSLSFIDRIRALFRAFMPRKKLSTESIADSLTIGKSDDIMVIDEIKSETTPKKRSAKAPLSSVLRVAKKRASKQAQGVGSINNI